MAVAAFTTFFPNVIRRQPARLARVSATRCMCTAPSASLYLVSTPIGNALDITLRARDILRTVDTVAAEDTRTTRRLLRSLDSPNTQSLLSCHEHNWASRIPTLLARLREGRSVALVSDAGTPCVSDPGAELVNAVVTEGFHVVPVPGACAALAALVASGLPVAAFQFFGFLPRSGKPRRSMLESVAAATSTVVLYEAPHRIVATLSDLAQHEDACRAVCLAREVTKKWEEFLRFDNLRDASQFYQVEKVQPRGEYTIVLAPPKQQPVQREDLRAYSATELNVSTLVERLVEEGIPVSSIARSVASASSVPKKLVYSYASKLKDTVPSACEDSPAGNRLSE